MVDRYTSFTDLAQQTTEGEDWSIHTEERGTPHLITAIHGGAIER
ncbi:poly-gamma-glutamate hydrolase family protein, partial [Staphylococcus epidermidis]